MNDRNQDSLICRLLNDLGGAFGIALVRMGMNLGLYEQLMQDGPVTSNDLAARCGLAERYVREWLAYNVASHYVCYDSVSDTFAFDESQAAVFADTDSACYMADAYDAAAAYLANQPKVENAFRTGGGVAWGDQASCLYCAVARFFRPGYNANIVDHWLPALQGVVAKLESGATVVDVGCGHGYSTVMMARAFPRSRFLGVDFHEASIQTAERHAATHAGLDNVNFAIAPASDLPHGEYDLATCFDCLHDMGDPVGAAASIRNRLKSDGTLMLVEPYANDTLAENINPVSRLYYAASTMVCIPTSLAQPVGAALGAQAGEARLREVIESAGFRKFKRATETPFNLVLEARP